MAFVTGSHFHLNPFSSSAARSFAPVRRLLTTTCLGLALAVSLPAQQPATAPAQQPPAQTPSTTPAPAPAQTSPVPPAPDPGQQQQQQPSAPVQTITTFAREVPLIFTVADGKGHFVTGLKQENFSLLDDGKPPERVIKFSQQTNLPLRVGVLLDTSNSIRQRFQFEQDSATEFFLQVLHRSDSAFVVGFDVKTQLAQDYTNNIDLLSTAIHKLRPGGGTAFYDALYKTCRDQMLTLKTDTAIRKAIIVVSDGDDNYSRVEEPDAIKMCQRAETIVYTISTNVSPSKDKGDDVLKRFSEATGGRAFYPTRIEDVANGFRSIEEELRSQYLLQYAPAEFKQDGAFRTIYLFSNDRRFKVRTRAGYFAPRPPQP